MLAAWLARNGGWSPALFMASGVVLLGAPLLLAGEMMARRAAPERLATR